MKTLIIDRIEGEMAVCEISVGNFADIPVSALPDGIKEGDVINISVNEAETEKRKKNINSLLNKLFRD